MHWWWFVVAAIVAVAVVIHFLRHCTGCIRGRRRVDVSTPLTVIITGAASGIGRALVLELLKRIDDDNEKLNVIAIDLRDIDLKHKQLTTLQASVTDAPALQDFADELKANGIRCDALCCCAGLTLTGPLTEVNTTSAKCVLDVNTFGESGHIL